MFLSHYQECRLHTTNNVPLTLSRCSLWIAEHVTCALPSRFPSHYQECSLHISKDCSLHTTVVPFNLQNMFPSHYRTSSLRTTNNILLALISMCSLRITDMFPSHYQECSFITTMIVPFVLQRMFPSHYEEFSSHTTKSEKRGELRGI